MATLVDVKELPYVAKIRCTLVRPACKKMLIAGKSSVASSKMQVLRKSKRPGLAEPVTRHSSRPSPDCDQDQVRMTK